MSKKKDKEEKRTEISKENSRISQEEKVLETSVLKEEAKETVSQKSEEGKQERKQPDSSQEPKEEKKFPRKTTRLERRGKKYREVAKLIDKTKTYSLDEALELLKKTSITKFDASVEFHTKVLIDGFRALVHLPHGTGKEKKVMVFTKENISEAIEQILNGKIDFDVAIATPEVMRELAKVAKILGPKGLMPSPKSGTVTSEPERVVEELKKGKVELRVDKGGALHQVVGKVSWPNEKLKENILALIAALPQNKLGKLFLTTTMGPSIRIAPPAKR